MKRTLLSACVVALTFTACKNDSPRSAQRSGPIAPVSSAKVAPQGAPRDLPPPLAPPPVAVMIPDAGGDIGAPPPDALALAHAPDHVDHLTRAQQLRSEGDLAGALTEARDAGVAASDAIAAAYCAPDRVPLGRTYLRENIQYTLGEEEEAGLRRFYELAARHGLVGGTRPLAFF